MVLIEVCPFTRPHPNCRASEEEKTRRDNAICGEIYLEIQVLEIFKSNIIEI